MKGITKIQLINAKTNKVEKEVVEENYLTQFMNQIHEKMAEYPIFRESFMLDKKFKDFAQGVALLGNLKPIQSAGCMNTEVNDVSVGYAYDLYSGDDVKRGSLNELESGDLYDGDRISGYRKVWDFGTNVAVGTINSICLGGDYLGTTDIQNVVSAYNTNYMGYESSPMVADISDNYLLITDGGTLGTNGYFNYNDFWIWKFNKKRVTYHYSIKGLPSLSYTKNFTDHYLVDISEPAPVDYIRAIQPCIDNNYFYVLYYQTGVGFKIHKYDILTNAFVEELTFNFSYTANPVVWKITSDKLIWTNSNDVYWTYRNSLSEHAIMDTPGTITAINISKKHADNIICLGDRFDDIYITSTNDDNRFETYYVDLIEEKVWSHMYPMSIGSYYRSTYRNVGYSSGIYVDEPIGLILAGTIQPSLSDQSLWKELFIPYKVLSAINNLSSPLVKEADQILKVIYDIVW